MKNLRHLFSLLLLAVFVAGYGQITGSAHDFTASGWAGGNICVACHTPHHGDQTVPEAPLWNHQVTAATYTLYTGTTMDATTAQPGGESKLCLSCHDGTVALDSYGGATGSTMMTGDGLIGTDLSNDHPISFTYDATLATNDGSLHDPTTANSGLGGTIDEDMLFGGVLQCASCHDVHNQDGYGNLLRVSNAGSALCLTCHDK